MQPLMTDSFIAMLVLCRAAGNLVALLAEEEGGLGKALGRQLLRTRRNFTATVFSPDGAWQGGLP